MLHNYFTIEKKVSKCCKLAEFSNIPSMHANIPNVPMLYSRSHEEHPWRIKSCFSKSVNNNICPAQTKYNSGMSTVAPGHPEESAGYSLLLSSIHTHLVCSSPGVWGSAASLAEREQSKQALCKGTTCSGIHPWTRHAQQSEKDKDKRMRGSLFPFFFFTAQYPSSVVVLHSSV